jgi:Flp pilus assembly protein TadD
MTPAVSPLELACKYRFPAWTLYARAFSGSRSHADYLVQKAVSGVSREPAAPSTEAEFHAHVLSFIRESALRSMPAPARSLLALIQEPGPGELEAAQRRAARRLSELPRERRRSIEGVLLRRPAWSLAKVAAREGVSPSFAAATIESGLRAVAARVYGANRRPSEGADAGAHTPLDALLAYVQGVLTADEARSVTSHASTCVACGDRLGTMMLLKAASIETLRLPRLPRGARRAAVALLVAGLVAGGVLVARELMPNPWKAHATRETVPGWFYSFLYRGEDARSSGEIARGLALLVNGKYEEAIEALEPRAYGRSPDPEAATYLGIARYLSGDSSRGTVRLLESGTSSSRSGRLARWYLASVLLARGDVEDATVHLEELATVRDWFGRAAEALLEKLEQEKEPRGTLAAG